MSVMVEIYLREGQMEQKRSIVESARKFSGNLTFEENESSAVSVSKGVCLTFEFELYEQAEKFGDVIKCDGFHVEGPYDY